MPDRLDEFLDADDARLDAFLGESEQQSKPSAREGFLAKVRQAAAQAQGPLPGAARLTKGFARGLRRLPGEAQEPVERAGEMAGRVAPGVAGSLVAGALTGGAGFLPAVAAQALGAGAGEAFGQIGARAAGGQAPESSLEAALEVGRAARNAAAAQAAISGTLGAAKAILPGAARTFAGISERASERGLKRPSTSTAGPARGSRIPETAESVEFKGMGILKNLQNKAESVLARFGKRVEIQANKLQMRTRGAKVVDLTPAADAAESAIQEAITNPITGKLIEKSEARAILDVVSRIRKQPLQDFKTAIFARRALDDLTAFKMGRVQKVASDAGKRAVSAAREVMRAQIDAAAKRHGGSEFLFANSGYSRFRRLYDDELSPLLGVKTESNDELARRFKGIIGRFNDPGARSAILQNMGQRFPEGAKDFERLLDLAASRAFAGPTPFTPSSLNVMAARIGLSPQGFGRMIRAIPDVERLGPSGTFSLAQMIEDQIRRQSGEQR